MKEIKKSYNLNEIFKTLDSKSIEELESYFIPNLSAIDALRVILYKYALSILSYKKRILKHENPDNLHQFRINIRKSRAFLKEFGFLMSKKHLKYFNDNLCDFATQTNKKRDLDVIKDRLSELDKDHKMIQRDIKQKRKVEHHSIQKMLQSKTCKNFFHTYKDILLQEALLNSDNTTSSIKKTAKQVILYLHHKIIKKINALEKDFDVEKLHKIRISLKKLRYLLEEFQHIFGEKKIEKMIEEGKKLQTLLGEFNDAVNQKKLLHEYFKGNKKKISHAKSLEHKLLDETVKTQEKLMHKAIKKLHKFKEKPLKL